VNRGGSESDLKRRNKNSAHGTVASTPRKPPEEAAHDLFLLEDRNSVKKVRLTKGECLGVYQGSGPGGELLCASRSPIALYRKLKRLKGIRWPVSTRRARSKKELLRPLPSKRGRFEWLMDRAFEAVAAARTRLDPNYILHPKEPKAKEAAIRQAQTFLRDVANEARAKGRSRGDKATPAENRRILDVLRQLAQGATLKAIAIDKCGTGNFEKAQRSLSVRLDRFSARVVRPIREIYGQVPAGFITASLYSDAILRYFFRDWPGVSFPYDLIALREALRRHRPNRS
jgi:hypothetical protein